MEALAGWFWLAGYVLAPATSRWGPGLAPLATSYLALSREARASFGHERISNAATELVFEIVFLWSYRALGLPVAVEILYAC